LHFRGCDRSVTREVIVLPSQRDSDKAYFVPSSFRGCIFVDAIAV